MEMGLLPSIIQQHFINNKFINSADLYQEKLNE
jgi:hypothetical protein